jgi:hypothetical protein
MQVMASVGRAAFAQPFFVEVVIMAYWNFSK